MIIEIVNLQTLGRLCIQHELLFITCNIVTCCGHWMKISNVTVESTSNCNIQTIGFDIQFLLLFDLKTLNLLNKLFSLTSISSRPCNCQRWPQTCLYTWYLWTLTGGRINNALLQKGAAASVFIGTMLGGVTARLQLAAGTVWSVIYQSPLSLLKA